MPVSESGLPQLVTANTDSECCCGRWRLAVLPFILLGGTECSTANMRPATSLLAFVLAIFPHHASGFSLNVMSNQQLSRPSPSSRTLPVLFMSLKPAAIPLLDSGKALARSGELLIDATTSLDLYGGGLSQAGASIRNSGDCVAQAAASCRFKTAAELVTDELREGATCLLEGASTHLKRAVEEAKTDEDEAMEATIIEMIPIMTKAAESLESSGAAILQRREVAETGKGLYECGEALEELAKCIRSVSPDVNEASESCDRMTFAALKMREAGDNLRGVEKAKPKGKAWLKG